MAASILAWFVPWYLQRYYSVGWTVIDPFRILMLGICTGVLLVMADWARTAEVKNAPKPATMEQPTHAGPLTGSLPE
jgi:hypothetical protein